MTERSTVEANEVESEVFSADLTGEGQFLSKYPFDTTAIDITDSRTSVFNSVQRIRSGDIDLAPEYQRYQDLWNEPQQSRLIESLLLGIPLQVIYFDAEYGSDTQRMSNIVRRQIWHVVDGVQRLSSIRNFVIGGSGRDGNVKKLRLKGLEYLTQLNDMSYDDLPPTLQMTIHEAIIPYYLILPTPEEIKFNILKRVNTGGLPLTQQEIRHALFNGRGTRFIGKLAENKLFQLATGNKIPSKRMLDQEFVNRFLAFYLLDSQESYRTMDSFLNDAIRTLNIKDETTLSKIESEYEDSLRIIVDRLGDKAFRRYMPEKQEWNKKINKAVFETLVAGMARLGHDGRAELNKRCDIERWYQGLFDDQGEDSYTMAVTRATGNRFNVILRQEIVSTGLRKEVETYNDNAASSEKLYMLQAR